MANPVGDFLKTVTTAGTRVALSATELKVATAVVQALASNTGYITLGSSTVVASTFRGLTIEAASSGSTPASISLVSSRDGANEIDLSQIFIDSELNGNGVAVFWTKA